MRGRLEVLKALANRDDPGGRFGMKGSRRDHLFSQVQAPRQA